jgi:diguanylate cyclase (GGDEF)-like protein
MAPEPAVQLPSAAAAHPMNSARLLFQLVSLESPAESDQGWDSIIHRTVMRRLMLTLQYRDPDLVRHSRQVAGLAVGVAEQLGWGGQQLHVLEAASLLHDIGKIGIPDIILFKPGQLAPEEAELMGLLYRITSDVLQACKADRQVVEIIIQSQHHYNEAADELGTEMHQGARILAVADAYESLVNRQSYRDANSHVQALDILSRGAGSRFDGNVISALGRWFESNPGAEKQTSQPQQYELSHEEVLEAGTLSHAFSYLYLVESLYHGFHITDAELRPLVWNTGCERLTGISWKQALNSPRITDIVEYRDRYGEPLSLADRPVLLAAETGQALTTELQIHTADGRWLPVEVQTMPITDSNGRIEGFAEIYRDHSLESKTGEYRDLKLMASRDALTHVANRGELEDQLKRFFQEYVASGRKTPFSVIFLDVDHFKKTNDTYGHAAGDEVLVSLTRLLQNETYSGELVARFGGEEFVILCPETRLDDALKRAERLRHAISRARVVNSNEFTITASFGVAEVEPTDKAATVIERADKALYMSKHAGRNKSSKLTSAQQKAADATMVTPPENSGDAFIFRHKLRACIAADMIVYKLSAFVDAHGAKLGKVSKELVTMKVGHRGLVPFWGATPDRQPLNITLEIGDERSVLERGASKLVEIGVSMTPQGWCRNAEVFQKRARGLLKNLREYLAADHDDDEIV